MLMIWTLHFVGGLPDLEEADGGMEAVEDGQWHRDMRDYRPGPDAEEVQMRWSEGCLPLDQGVDEPDRHVCDQQECHQLPARLDAVLLSALAASPPGIHYEEGLQAGLE